MGAVGTVVAENQSYGAKTAANVAWLGAAQLLRQLSSIVTTVFLARLLSPTDYGLFGMTVFVSELAQLLISFGIGSALVQRIALDDRLLSTCFWANLCVGFLIGGLVILTSPLVADYYGQARIPALLSLCALNLVLGAAMVIPQVILARSLDFQQVAVGGVVGSLCGTAGAIVLGVFGAGVWALVAQPVIGSVVTLLWYFCKVQWRPAFIFDLTALKGVLSFAVNVFLDNLLGHFARNMHHLLAAPMLGAAAMGQLTLAGMAAWLPIAQFTQAAVRATFPVFAKLQAQPERMAAGLQRTFRLIALAAFPTVIGLAFFARDLVPMVFGAQWQSAVPLVMVLCVPALVLSVANFSGAILMARGNTLLGVKLAAGNCVLMAAGLMLARDHGVFWVAVAMAAAQSIGALVSLHLVLRAIPRGWVSFMHAVTPAFVVSLLTGVCLLVLQLQWLGEATPTLRLSVLVPLGLLLYVAMAYRWNPQGWQTAREVLRQRPR